MKAIFWELETDSYLTDVNNMETFYTYDCIVHGVDVWKREWGSDEDPDGKFNRYQSYGPFYDLMQLLERMNLLDNKIAIKYKNGLYLGYYDGVFTIGTSVHKFWSHEKSHEEILERYNRLNSRIEQIQKEASESSIGYSPLEAILDSEEW